MQASARELPIFAVAVLCALSGFRVDAQVLFSEDSWIAKLEVAVSHERELQGLTPVQPSAALRKAAQAHADDMERAGYFAVQGPPDSPTIESLLDKEGYHYTLVTEKLVRTPIEETVEHLVAGWHAKTDANRASLFHADVREIGVGVVESGAMRIVTIVLASANAPQPVSPQAAAFSALAQDPAAARKALSEALTAQRLAWGLSTLRVDASLGEAAARHAEDLLEALIENRPASDVISLADLVDAQRARSGAPVEMSSGEVTRQRRHAPRGNGVGESVGHLIVTDAATPEEALQVALRQPDSSALHDARYRVVAVGLAVKPAASAAATGHAVWVIALATH
jgi:uncharacterized protein YkwD